MKAIVVWLIEQDGEPLIYTTASTRRGAWESVRAAWVGPSGEWRESMVDIREALRGWAPEAYRTLRATKYRLSRMKEAARAR